MEYIHLIGAEQVQSAARTISEAADRMNHAAVEMQGAADYLQRGWNAQQEWMEQWLTRLEEVLVKQPEPVFNFDPEPVEPEEPEYYPPLPDDEIPF